MLAARAHRGEELARAGQIAHEMRAAALQRADIELEVARPMIEAVPVQRAGDRVEAPRERSASLGHADAVCFGVMLGQELEPEEVIEREVEQRAVHVDEHRVDSVPVDARGCSLHAGNDTRAPCSTCATRNRCSHSYARSPPKPAARSSRSTAGTSQSTTRTTAHR